MDGVALLRIYIWQVLMEDEDGLPILPPMDDGAAAPDAEDEAPPPSLRPQGEAAEYEGDSAFRVAAEGGGPRRRRQRLVKSAAAQRTENTKPVATKPPRAASAAASRPKAAGDAAARPPNPPLAFVPRARLARGQALGAAFFPGVRGAPCAGDPACFSPGSATSIFKDALGVLAA